MIWTRREWLGAMATLATTSRAASAATVASAPCPSYGADMLLPALRGMFDQLGGVAELVSGKTVAVKINMSGPLSARIGHRPGWLTHWTHPDVIVAAVRLFGEAGAARIRVLESSIDDDSPLEQNFLVGGADPEPILNAASNVEMENTAFLGSGSRYHRVEVPGGGLIYPGFDLNHSYVECDVFVSIAKLNRNPHSGVALSMENLIGITPVTIYGAAAGYDDPSVHPYGERKMFETGYRQPSSTAPAEIDPDSPREAGYRIPRIIVDLAGARPIHLAIIDGIESVAKDTGQLFAGFDAVAADAAATTAMGFDPMAEHGTAPFEQCDNYLALAEEAGLGKRVRA